MSFTTTSGAARLVLRTPMATSTTSPCHLLCAAKAAEEIEGTSLQPDPCYYDEIGFVECPTVIVGGLENIDACLVGTTADAVILSFRGTLPPAPNLPSVLDWLQDFFAVLVERPGLPGKVHEGFYDSVVAIFDQVLAEVKAQVSASGLPLIVTGHSKGASMATIAAMLLHNADVAIQEVRVFASPNTGDADFASGFDAVFSGSLTLNRYLNYLDVVPLMPPTDALAKELAKAPLIGHLFEQFETAGYTPVGNGIFVEKDGTLISRAEHWVTYDADILDDLEAIKSELEKGDFSTILNAHSLSCGYGYMKGVCQDTVCSSSNCQKS